jgi:UDP-N-acetylglucosamine 2-epimerase (non-hydrolysing)
MLKIINVVGARPNFMKIAPIVEAMKRREREFSPLVVHTGQHYDAATSDAFFHDLELPQPFRSGMATPQSALSTPFEEFA